MSAVHLEKMLRSLGTGDGEGGALPCLTLHEWSLRHFRQGSPPLAPEHHRLFAVRSCPLSTGKDEERASEGPMEFSGDASARRRRSSNAEPRENSPAERRSPSGALKVIIFVLFLLSNRRFPPSSFVSVSKKMKIVPLQVLRRWTSVVYRTGRGGSARAKRAKSTTSTAPLSQ